MKRYVLLLCLEHFWLSTFGRWLGSDNAAQGVRMGPGARCKHATNPAHSALKLLHYLSHVVLRICFHFWFELVLLVLARGHTDMADRHWIRQKKTLTVKIWEVLLPVPAGTHHRQTAITLSCKMNVSFQLLLTKDEDDMNSLSGTDWTCWYRTEKVVLKLTNDRYLTDSKSTPAVYVFGAKTNMCAGLLF